LIFRGIGNLCDSNSEEGYDEADFITADVFTDNYTPQQLAEPIRCPGR
jgi:hypothetical protein